MRRAGPDEADVQWLGRVVYGRVYLAYQALVSYLRFHVASPELTLSFVAKELFVQSACASRDHLRVVLDIEPIDAEHHVKPTGIKRIDAKELSKKGLPVVFLIIDLASRLVRGQAVTVGPAFNSRVTRGQREDVEDAGIVSEDIRRSPTDNDDPR